MPSTPNTATVTVNYDATTGAITVNPSSVQVLRSGRITFQSPDADLVVICGDNTTHPSQQWEGWFVHGNTGNVFFVAKGQEVTVSVKGSNAIADSPYDYSVVLLTTDPNTHERDKVLHSEDPTVIIRDN